MDKCTGCGARLAVAARWARATVLVCTGCGRRVSRTHRIGDPTLDEAMPASQGAAMTRAVLAAHKMRRESGDAQRARADFLDAVHAALDAGCDALDLARATQVPLFGTATAP